MTTMPLDLLGNPVPTLGYADGGAKTVTITTTSNRNAVAIGTNARVISIYATTPCFLRFGDNTVTATTTDHFFPAGLYHDVAVGPSTKDRYIAAIRLDTDGTLYISERE